MMKALRKGQMVSELPDSNLAHVVQDLRTVKQLDKWPLDWLADWQKWEAKFTDSNYHFGKNKKAVENYHWIFGRDPTTVEERLSPNQSPTFGYSGYAVAPLPPARSSADIAPQSISELESPNILDPAGVPPQAPPASAVPTSALFRRLLPRCTNITPPAPSPNDANSTQSTHSAQPSPVVPQGEHERDSLIQKLNNNSACEGLTIASLTSADTVPLGTDLDPQNHYNNLWGANQVNDQTAKLLVQYNLCCRVIDAENVGFSFGQDVLGKVGYNVEGVRRAVQHFQKSGVEVILVHKRKDVEQFKFGDGVQLVRAESTDDVIVLKQAKMRNCPIVSRDGFAKWKDDLRLAPDLRQWLLESADIQVRFSWGAGGAFVPDFDLPRPVMRRTTQSRQQGPICNDCGQPQGDNVVPSRAQGKGGQQWYCDDCFVKWMRS